VINWIFKTNGPKFKSSGIEIGDDIKDNDYGLREFSFIDSNGYYIRVAEESAE